MVYRNIYNILFIFEDKRMPTPPYKWEPQTYGYFLQTPPFYKHIRRGMTHKPVFVLSPFLTAGNNS